MSYFDKLLPSQASDSLDTFLCMQLPGTTGRYSTDWWHGYSERTGTIYTGLVPYALYKLRKMGLEVALKDERTRPPTREIPTNITLRDYQEPVVQKLHKCGRGTASLATGAGKTIIFIELFARCGARGVIIVPTQIIWRQFIRTAIWALLRPGEQLPENFETMTAKRLIEWAKGKTHCEIGAIGRGMWEEGYLTIAISAALGKDSRARQFLEGCDFFYNDEHHHGAAATYFQNLMRSNAYYRYGGSGTMQRTDGQDLKLYATTGPTIARITSSQLIEKGWLAQPVIKMVECPTISIGNPKHWATFYKANILYNEDRTRIAVGLLGHSIANNIKTLCLVAWDEHAQELLSRLSPQAKQSVRYVTAKMKRAEIADALEAFRRDEATVLMATPLLSEGYDLCSIDRLIRASAMRSPIKITQETGRVLRIDNPPRRGEQVELWDFYDMDGGVLQQHAQARFAEWQSEEGFIVQRVHDWAQPQLGMLEGSYVPETEEDEDEYDDECDDEDYDDNDYDDGLGVRPFSNAWPDE